MKAKALRCILESGEEHPTFEMAKKGQILDVIESFSEKKFGRWSFRVQDIDRKYPPFYVDDDEIELLDEDT